MAEQTNHQRMADLKRLADRLIDDASKDKVSEALRILALEIAHYQMKYGVVPLDEAIAMLATENLTSDQAGWVADSFENIAATLASIPEEESAESPLH